MTTRVDSGIWIVLIASLAVNLFLGGMMFSSRLGHRPGHHDGRPFALMHRMAELEGPAGDAVRARYGSEIRRSIQEMHEARRAVRRALAADSFDAVALQSALDRMRRQTERAQVNLHAALAEVAALLPAAERRQLLTRFEHRRPPPMAPNGRIAPHDREPYPPR